MYIHIMYYQTQHNHYENANYNVINILIPLHRCCYAPLSGCWATPVVTGALCLHSIHDPYTHTHTHTHTIGSVLLLFLYVIITGEHRA